MRTGLLTLAALSWAASAMAGDWQKPVPATLPSLNVGEEVYFYNQGAQQFLTKGNSWGTQASLGDTGLLVMVKDSCIVAEGEERPEGVYMLYNVNENRYFDQSGDATAAWVDRAIDATNQWANWKFEFNADGTFRFGVTNANLESLEYETSYWAGWNGEEDNTVVTVLFSQDEMPEGSDVWLAVSPEAYKAYEAKWTLYDMLENASKVVDEEGEPVEVNTSAAEAVYNNPASTSEELIAAAAALNVEITKAKIGDRFDGASPEEPKDATFLIKNPSFEDGKNNWTATFTGSQSSVNDAGTNIYTNADETAQLYPYFMENWVNGGKTLADYYCRQTLASLPAGAYTLYLDVIAIQQGSATDEITGANLFVDINGDSTKVACSCHLTGQTPTRYKLPFLVLEDGTDVTIGFETKGTNANWVAFDNWGLSYQGNSSSPELLTLGIEVEKLESVIATYMDPESGKYLFNAKTLENAEQLIADAKEMDATTDAEEIVAKTEAIENAYKQVLAEKAAYSTLDALNTSAKEGMNTFEAFGEIVEALNEISAAIEENVYEGSLTIEDIDKLHADYDHVINEILPSVITPGTDLTIMLKNPNFDNNSRAGWTVDPKVGDGKWTNVAAGCAEMWNKDFNVYQDLKNLPTGLYEVGLQGFVRQGTFQGAFDNYCNGTEDIRGYVYGTTGLESGEVKTKRTPFKSVFEGKDTAPHFTSETDISHIPSPAGGVDSKIVDPNTQEEYYIPNGMTGFALWEELGDDRFKTTAQVFVTDGTLRIGAISDDHRDFDFWCIFDSFTLTYVSPDMVDALYSGVEQEIERLKTKRDNLLKKQPLPKDISEKVNALTDELAAIERTENAIEAMAEKVSAVEKEMLDIAAAYKKQAELFNYCNSNKDDILAYSEDFTYSEWLDNLYGAGKYDLENYTETIDPESPEFYWDTTEDMLAEGDAIRNGWVKFVTANPELASASADQPVEVSAAIINHDFPTDANNEFTAFGWEGATGAANQYEYEFFNKTFDMYQTFSGLPAGWYYADVQGFYRAGGHADAATAEGKGEYEHNAVVYADVNGATYSKPLMGIFESLNEDESVASSGSVTKTIKYGDDKEVTYIIPDNMACAQVYFDEGGFYAGNTVGFKVNDANDVVKLGVKKDSLITNDWTIFNYVKLFYTGTEVPNSIGAALGSSLAVKQAYYTVGGQKLARPQKGVNIIVTTLSDGSKVSTKVLVK